MKRRLALDAGFQQAECIQTKGRPGVFATLDAGARKTLGLYFMYDVKQVDPSEWQSPPWEDRRHGHGDALVRRLPVSACVRNASADSCAPCRG